MFAVRPSPLAVAAVPRPDRDTLLPLLRWLILGAALGLCLLALNRADAVGAAAPANCIPINQTSCLSNGVIYTNGTATATIGQPNSIVLPSYAVPGIAYPFFGYGGYVGANYSPAFPAYYGGYYNNFFSENYGYLGTNCDPKAWWCLNYEYTGNVFSNLFSPGTGAAMVNTPAVAPGGAVTPTVIYRPAEVVQPTAITQPAALNAPVQTQTLAPTADVKVLSVQTTTAPAASYDGRDDGK